MLVTEALPLALEFLGDSLPEQFRWKPGQRCLGCSARTSRVSHAYHDIPCPPLTDALAMAMLRALPARGYEPNLYRTWFDPGDVFVAHDDWVCVIVATDVDHFPILPAKDPAHAIVLAVAALAESVNARRPS